jgi:hypothetical protein
MAYSNSPKFQTYKTVTVKFDDTPTHRSGFLQTPRDSSIWNMFYDRVSQENKTRDVHLKKRPGLTTTTYPLTKNSASDQIRGNYYDADSHRFYWAVNNHVYYVAPNTSASAVLVTTLTTTTGYVGFCEFLRSSDTTRFVVFSDGQELWLDEIGGTATKVTDVDLPVPHIPQPVQLDGYIFLAKRDTNDMYNCVNDDPFSWEAGDYISAEMSGDVIVHLANNRNYVLAFGRNSVEIFWNAAVVSGSPMKRNEAGFKRVGYVGQSCNVGDILYFIGQDQNKLNSVYKLDGFKLERISNEVVDRAIQPYVAGQNQNTSVYLDRNGLCLSIDGHTFYVVYTTQTTWVYDIDEKMWYEWKNPLGESLDLQASWAMYNGGQYVAIGGQTTISLMSPTIYQDFGTNFTCRYVTQDLTFETSNWKSCNRLYLQSDRHLATGTSNVNVSWSDDDWATTQSTVPLNVFSSSSYITRLGRFRTRSFKLEYTDNYPLRLKQLDLDINVGSS